MGTGHADRMTFPSTPAAQRVRQAHDEIGRLQRVNTGACADHGAIRLCIVRRRGRERRHHHEERFLAQRPVLQALCCVRADPAFPCACPLHSRLCALWRSRCSACIGPWLIALVPCVTVAPVASYIGWDYANPALYVDNGFSSPIQVWVDGVAREVAPPAKGEVGSFTMRMPRGRHVLGYSRVGAASPVTTIEANILENDRHLYNPGLMSCHYVHLAVYGSTEVSPFDRPSVPDQLLGPLPIAELYNLDRVDYWLEPAPETIRVRLTERQYRTALSRNRPCLELARRGCALRLRQDLVRCQFLAETTADVLRCIHKAEVACDREPREPFIP